MFGEGGREEEDGSVDGGRSLSDWSGEERRESRDEIDLIKEGEVIKLDLKLMVLTVLPSSVSCACWCWAASGWELVSQKKTSSSYPASLARQISFSQTGTSAGYSIQYTLAIYQVQIESS